MEFKQNDTITATKLKLKEERLFLVIRWQTNSFESYIYSGDKIWKGQFSTKRLLGFSKNLRMTEVEYFNSVKRCLSEYRNDYEYELSNGFFYWKRQSQESTETEGFFPVELLEPTPKGSREDLIYMLRTLNNYMREKIKNLKIEYKINKLGYLKCITDTEEFLNSKAEIDNALSENFLNLLGMQKINETTEIRDLNETKIENEFLGRTMEVVKIKDKMIALIEEAKHSV